MRHVEVHALGGGITANELFDLLADFERYPTHSEAVRHVTVTRTANGVTSDWEVSFRQGILRWTEEDHFDRDALTISFKQIAGDAQEFFGKWVLEQVDGGCAVRFMADFDMGIPSLGSIIEPIAEQALQENIRSILTGLLAGRLEFLPPVSSDC